MENITNDIFKKIVEQAGESIVVTDLKGNIVYVNKAFENVTGYSESEVLGKNPKILKSGKHGGEFYKILWKTILSGKVWRGEILNKKKNGENFFEKAIIFPLKNSDDKITHFAKIAIDITSTIEIEKRFRTIVDNAPNPMGVYIGEKIVYVNKAAVKTVGAKDEREILGRSIYEFIHPDYKEELKDRMEKLYAGEVLSPVEQKIITLDGRIIEILVNAVLITYNNEPAILSQMVDISKQKEVERKLKESEEKYKNISHLYRLMADNIPDLVWAKDTEGKFLFVNKADAEFLGAKDTEEPIGKDDMFFVKRYRAERPDRDDWFTFGEQCINSDEVVLRNRRPGRFDEFGNVRGKYLHLDVYKAPIFDENGKLIGTVGHGRIVTKEREMEKKLKESEEKFRMLFEESQDVIFITTLDGKFIDINPAGLKFFGYDSVEEIKKVDIAKDIYKHVEDREFFVNEVKKKGKIKDYEITFKRKDGKEVIGLLSATPIFDKNRNLKGLRGTIKDITDKKMLEVQLLHAQKMESIGRLTGGIAHDFNNILTVINGFSEIALKKISEDHPLYKSILSIYNAGIKAKNLISKLMAFSRKHPFNPEILNLNQLILSLEKMLRQLIGEDVELQIVLYKDLPYIKADASQIEQILLNLVVNAKDAIEDKLENSENKRITIETGIKHFEDNYFFKISGIRSGLYSFISITDNGIGMDEDTKNKIFEPYFTTKEKNRGTGLGLSVIFTIVKQNNGFIDVDSELNRGTTFKIYFPVTAEEENIVEERDSENKITFGKGNILIVEDNNDVRTFAAEALKTIGYNVYEAENGKKALRKIEEINLTIDVVITDIIMPEINGWELSEKIKKRFPQIKIIYTSGYSGAYLKNFEKLVEGENFLRKPFTLKELANIVKKAIEIS